MGAPDSALNYPRPQFQEEADSVSQTLAKLNSSLDTQYSPAPGAPPGALTELLQQLEVRAPHPAGHLHPTPGIGAGLCLGLTLPWGLVLPRANPGGQEKGICSSRRGLLCCQKPFPTLDPFPHL